MMDFVGSCKPLKTWGREIFRACECLSSHRRAGEVHQGAKGWPIRPVMRTFSELNPGVWRGDCFMCFAFEWQKMFQCSSAIKLLHALWLHDEVCSAQYLVWQTMAAQAEHPKIEGVGGSTSEILCGERNSGIETSRSR